MQTASTTPKIDARIISQRLFSFAVGVVRLINELPSSLSGRHIGGQLLRSGTSIAANYEEACAAESKADFVHKLQIVLKELRESRFWLRLLGETECQANEKCRELLQEADELCNIIAKSVITAKSSLGKRKA